MPLLCTACSITEANKYSQEELRFMKSQDASYLALKAQTETKVCLLSCNCLQMTRLHQAFMQQILGWHFDANFCARGWFYFASITLSGGPIVLAASLPNCMPVYS